MHDAPAGLRVWSGRRAREFLVDVVELAFDRFALHIEARQDAIEPARQVARTFSWRSRTSRSGDAPRKQRSPRATANTKQSP